MYFLVLLNKCLLHDRWHWALSSPILRTLSLNSWPHITDPIHHHRGLHHILAHIVCLWSSPSLHCDRGWNWKVLRTGRKLMTVQVCDSRGQLIGYYWEWYTGASVLVELRLVSAPKATLRWPSACLCMSSSPSHAGAISHEFTELYLCKKWKEEIEMK